ncbi:M48 family metallopeptidase [Thermosipho ferrireducens]|uniref:M48 family metallopeptidase n=1 Tax=Thermosipho ferrireducens TaxID=2571116 RepID=A0ABX7SBG3_9BACT|nr:M48 family metallopeptidase [Thermosipho ferrireducens]
MENIKIEKIIRTNRKSVALQITERATLIVRAPRKMKNCEIFHIISRHKKWIEKKIEEVKTAIPAPKQFVEGEKFLYLGKFYPLKIVTGQNVPLKFDNAFLLSQNVLTDAKNIFSAWYKYQAKKLIPERVEYYSQKHNFKYNKINITNAKKRWGSCSSKGNLNFSWYLIMAPIAVIDYVIIHELVHLIEKNHSKNFWKKVEQLMPDYKKYHLWLKEHKYMLTL